MTPTSDTYPNLQRRLNCLYALDGKGIKPGLKRIQEFLDRIGNPESRLKTIHVAGTNGKGSICAMLASVLQAAGLRVGLYTSPHLVRFNERIRINWDQISDGEIVAFIDRHQALIEALETTFFETTTAMALEHFADRAADVAILETGMGGRYDATNVTTPLMSIITPIGKDHEEFLGDTLEKIAGEKAGIIKSDIPVVVAKQRPRIREFLRDATLSQKSPFIYAPDHCDTTVMTRYPDRQIVNIRSREFCFDELDFPFLGDHQITNLNTVITALNHLTATPLSGAAVAAGITAARWHGRLELLSRKPLVYYDVGHNLHGIRQVVQALESTFPGEKFRFLIALGEHKKTDLLGKTIGRIAAMVYVSETPEKKSIPAGKLGGILKRDLPDVNVIAGTDFKQLFPAVLRQLGGEDHLVVLGSHYLAPVIYDFYKINV